LNSLALYFYSLPTEQLTGAYETLRFRGTSVENHWYTE